MVTFLFNDVSMNILVEIEEGKPSPQKELKRRVGTTDTYVTACTKKFESLGLVERSWGPRIGKRRASRGKEKSIILTQKGIQLREDLLKISALL